MAYLNDFKAILTDVDMTLCNSMRVVSPRLKKIIKELQEAQYYFAVCTGRSFAGLKEEILPLFPDKTLHIVSGGAQIIDSTGVIFWEKLIESELAHEIVELATSFNLAINLQATEHFYINEEMENYFLRTRRQVKENHFKPLSTIEDWRVPGIVIADVSDEFTTLIKQRNDVTVKQMTGTTGIPYVDITALGVNKATGIAEWSKYTGITAPECIGFGDSSNDEEFLQVVGMSLAMGNAKPHIKELAKKVIGSTDEDGLAIYLEAISKGAVL